MRSLYSAFLRPKQSRCATEWHVNGITQFLLATHMTILTLLCKHSPNGTTQTRQYTSDIAYLQPRKDERLSWPSWLTYSKRFTHISGHPSAAGRAWDRESSLVTHQRSTHCATQPTTMPTTRFTERTTFSRSHCI